MLTKEKIRREIDEHGLNYKRLAKAAGLHSIVVEAWFKALITVPFSSLPQTAAGAKEWISRNEHLRELWKGLGATEKKYLLTMTAAIRETR